MNVRLGKGWVDSFLECYTNQSLSTHPSPNPTQMTVGLEQGWVNRQYDSILECYINPSLSTHPFPYPTEMNVGLEQGWVDSFLECYTNPSLSTQPSSYPTQMNVGLGEGRVGSFSLRRMLCKNGGKFERFTKIIKKSSWFKSQNFFAEVILIRCSFR